MKEYKIFTINPGSTSTKLALFMNDRLIFSVNIEYKAEDLSRFESISDQLAYRKETIDKIVEEKGINLDDVDVVVGRGGGLLAMDGGTYNIDDLVLDHAKRGANGVQHPAMLGPQLAFLYAEEAGARSFVVNPPDVDELQDLARLTGIKGVYRNVHLHALNLKETAIRHSQLHNRSYQNSNYIVCHIGGGISISAHRQGKMVDGFDIVGGEGPMAPTRSGSVALADFLEYGRDKDYKDLKGLFTKNGGFVDHLGTSSALDIYNRAKDGDKYAALVWNTMIYQIAKAIGSMAGVLKGKIDGILLSGSMVYNENLIEQIKEYCGWIGELWAYPGEFEMEAMASGAYRVLTGEEELKNYSGKKNFAGFDFIK